MGFWSWLFPSDEEKIERARKLLQEEQYLAAGEYLRGVKGAEAEKLRVLAKAERRLEPIEEDPPMTKEDADRAVNFASQVVQRIKSKGAADRELRFAVEVAQQLNFNAPPPAERDEPFSEDPLEIAKAVVAQKGEGDPGPVFVDAVWLLKSRGVALPERVTRERESLAQFVETAASGDVQRALALLDDVTVSYVDVLLADAFPLELAKHEPVIVGPRLAAAVGARDPELALRLFNDREPLLLEALLAALDAGRSSAALMARWEEVEDPALRLEGQVRLLSRTDLTAAEKAWEAFRAETSDDTGFATEAFFARLAKHDAKRALELAVTEERSGTDEFPRVFACHLGGADVRPLIDSYLESFTASSYRPFTHFFELVGLCLRLEDEARLRQTLERGGPLGWQTTLAARTAIMRLAERQAPKLNALLDICSARYTPGFVAGRDASVGGLHVGNVVYRPDWLTETPPRAIETLRINAALGAHGPRWVPPRLA